MVLGKPGSNAWLFSGTDAFIVFVEDIRKVFAVKVKKLR